ncbi:hypothetical protein ACLIBG_07290 [Virgibacillus sp. W0181]|uniref:hypothetical protein n=1 Tax=Virgibacillus sp. W0181 TaxID=3391581 RepID=UPI003F46830B
MKIPALLAGPIIRRVEPARVYIWMATSSPFQIGADLYEIKQHETSEMEYRQINTITRTETVQTGEYMFIHLLKVIPELGMFPTDMLIGYNLLFSTRSDQFDLESLNLLSPENPNNITYGNLKYPSFFIQRNKPSHLLYGSCRKPHSQGSDVLAYADQTLEDTSCNLSERPSHLFLMGDQIYADDVSDPLFYVLSNWGEILMGNETKLLSGADTSLVKSGARDGNGYTEFLAEVDRRLKNEPFPSALNQVHGRQYIMENFCQFTSRNAANHLIKFSEFATMYLLTLSPALWESIGGEDSSSAMKVNTEKLFPTFEQLIDREAIYFKYPDEKPFEKERAKELKKHRKRYEEQLQALQLFLKALPQMRRVLANTPTYMIYDDHDITDDWNISAEWKERVHREPLGKHVVGNGLAAYWLFQGWGNDPDSFDHTFIYTMTDYFKTGFQKGPMYEKWLEQLWDFEYWCFAAPTNPISLFLDTRTMREYDISPQPVRIGRKMEEGTKAAELISLEGWEKTEEVLKKGNWNHGDALIIISPTPLYGLGIIESFLYKYIYPFRILGIPVRYELDFEAWKYNGKGFNQFIQQIANWRPRACFILSGDVHYANAVQSRIAFSAGQELVVNQFTSSPVHNMSFTGIWGFLLKTIIWFKSFKRKKRTLYRCCDEENNLHMERKLSTHDPSHQWREKIQYLSSEHGGIIETNNNIGLLTINEASVHNRLLVDDGRNEVRSDSWSIDWDIAQSPGWTDSRNKLVEYETIYLDKEEEKVKRGM